MGPLLFILYLNDICKVSDILEFILFADDTNIFCSGHDINTMTPIINNELVKLKNWFSINKLSLNVLKTNFMIFGNKARNTEIDLYINSEKICNVTSTKFLGVTIDCKLTWKDHISNVRSKLSKCNAIMYKVKHKLNSEALLMLYNSLFLPYLSYCLEIWGNNCKSIIDPLFIIQKKL